MPISTCFEEDHLVPLLTTESALMVFSSLDGSAYWLTDDATYRPIDISFLNNPYCVRGIPFFYDLEHVFSEIRIDVYPVTSTGLDTPKRLTLFAPNADEFEIQELVSMGSDFDNIGIVFYSGSNSVLLNINNGVTTNLPSKGSLCGFRASGEVFLQLSSDRWCSYLDAEIQEEGCGQILSISEETVLVKMPSKTGNDWSLVGRSRISILTGPHGWTIQSLASGNGVIRAYATHRYMGQALLSGTTDSPSLDMESRITGTAVPFAAGRQAPPIVRLTGLAMGSVWQLATTTLRGVVPADDSISAELVDICDLSCLKVTSRNRSQDSLVVSLHGGPDSHELDDIRYDGLYRRLLDAGHSILVINYTGSVGFGEYYQRQAWLNWDESIDQTVDAVTAALKESQFNVKTILGVSFGAWIAIQVAQRLVDATAVVFSPILNMSDHLQLHSPEDSSFADWAIHRFGRGLDACRSGDQKIQQQASRVRVYLPDDDEVVPPSQSEAALKKITSTVLHGWTVDAVPGRHYPSTQSEADHRWKRIYESISSQNERPSIRSSAAVAQETLES